jgi:hypothetical protein
MAIWSDYCHSHECTIPFTWNNTTYTSPVHWFRRQQIEIVLVRRHLEVLYTESVRQFLLSIFHS